MAGLASAMAISVISVFFGLAWVMFVPFVIIYIIERLRVNREGLDVGGLGAATIGSLMLSLAWQSLIGAIAVLLAHAIDDLGSDSVDTAMGLIVGALFASVVPAMMVRHAARAGAGRVLRSALGVNAGLNGLMSMVMTIALFVGWFNDGDKLGSLLAVTIVYTLATIVAARPLLSISSD